MSRRPRVWVWAALAATVPIISSGCGPAAPAAQTLSPGPTGLVSQSPASIPAGRGKAFPVLGVEIRAETTPIENGQRLSLGDGLSAEVFAVPFPPAPETDVHLFLLRGERAVSGAQLVVTYDMIDMDHGALDRQVGRELEDGHYALPLDLFMWGDWVAEVAIRHPEFDASFRLLLGVYPWRQKTP